MGATLPNLLPSVILDHPDDVTDLHAACRLPRRTRPPAEPLAPASPLPHRRAPHHPPPQPQRMPHPPPCHRLAPGARPSPMTHTVTSTCLFNKRLSAGAALAGSLRDVAAKTPFRWAAPLKVACGDTRGTCKPVSRGPRRVAARSKTFSEALAVQRTLLAVEALLHRLVRGHGRGVVRLAFVLALLIARTNADALLKPRTSWVSLTRFYGALTRARCSAIEALDTRTVRVTGFRSLGALEHIRVCGGKLRVS
jgi:hypothetical protein